MPETNTGKTEQMSHKVLIRPDLPLETLPSDPIIFDLVLFYLYDESTRIVSNSGVSVKIALVSYEKYGSIEEFKSLAYQKYKAILDMLCKHEIINSYNMEYASKPGLRKKWIQKDYVMDKVTIPYYLVECRFNLTKLQAYVKKRFARSKSYFEDLAQVYSRIIKIIEEFFTEPIILDSQLNRFYKSLVNKLRELFEQNILPYLYIQMAVPFDDLLFEQYQIQEIKQNLNKYIDPLHDNYAHLQQLISMYDLQNPNDASFNEIDEYFGKSQSQNTTESDETKQKSSKEKIKYFIKYLPTREIVLNNEYYLAQPDFNRENDKFFEFIFNRPDTLFTKEQIENEIKTKISKKLHQVVYQLGFKGALRKMFFPKVSQKAVAFRNNLTDQDIKELRIEQQLLQELKELTRFVPIRNSQER